MLSEYGWKSRAKSNYAIFGHMIILTGNCDKNRVRLRHIPARINRHIHNVENFFLVFDSFFFCFTQYTRYVLVFFLLNVAPRHSEMR